MALALLQETHQIVLALNINYGQNAYGREFKASKSIATHYDVPFLSIPLPWFSGLLPEAMRYKAFQTHLPTSHWHTEDGLPIAKEQVTERVWVPNRNGLFLNIAATYAEALGAEVIAFGANADEAENFSDNTVDFCDALNASLSYSTRLPIKVVAPVSHLSKSEMITLAKDKAVPLKLIWSCYESGQTPCHQCPSCRLLDKALSHQMNNASSDSNSSEMNTPHANQKAKTH
jgi:7-cyano-7-deazaguanine synthase